MNATLTAIEALRADLHTKIDLVCNEALAKLAPDGASATVRFKSPTPTDGHDPRNKNGVNLTPRGVEILYRVFDEGGGYNRAGKMLNISQGAAKNRKTIWAKLGGMNRQKQPIDIDLD